MSRVRTSKVLWDNGLWAVTTYGLEFLIEEYAISKERLWQDEPEYNWGRHIASKARIRWTAIPYFAFLEAWQMARDYHAEHMPKGGTVAIPPCDYLGERLELERRLLNEVLIKEAA